MAKAVLFRRLIRAAPILRTLAHLASVGLFTGQALATSGPLNGVEVVGPLSPALATEITLPAVLDRDDVLARTRGERTEAKSGASQSPRDPNALRDTLLSVMERYRSMSYVPYIWGGNKIGDQSSCQACRACVAGKPRLKVERRLSACPACRACGVDCSHFANRVLRDAGLDYPYLATREMSRSSALDLRKKFNLVDMGHDPRQALPGDLLLYPKHVVLLLETRGDGRIGDILQVSRAVKRKGMGGIEVVRDQDLTRFRGKLLRILRHGILFDGKPGRGGRGQPAPAAPSEKAGPRELTV